MPRYKLGAVDFKPVLEALDANIERLKAEMDATIYQLVDRKIARGEYQPQDREAKFKWHKERCEALADRIFNHRPVH